MEERRINGERRNHLMTDQDVAEKAGVSVNTVRYWRQTGILPFVKVGKHPRIWFSVFLQVFQKPLPYLADSADKMPNAGGDIRRQS
jgi:transcriptional regulator with XRE-family HTH domain